MSFISGYMNSDAMKDAADTQAAAAMYGADAQSAAAHYAADIQAMMAGQSIDMQWSMFMMQMENQAPWREAGVAALGGIAAGMQTGGEFATKVPIPELPVYGLKEFYNDPLYKVMMNQQGNILARNRAGAASGGSLGSGNQMVELMGLGNQNAEGYYQQGFNNRQTIFGDEFAIYNAKVAEQSTDYNRLASMAGLGQVAATQIGVAGQNTASNLANTYSNEANQLSNIATNAGNNAANSAMNIGNIRANQYMNQSSNWSNIIGGGAYGLGQINWGNLFGGGNNSGEGWTGGPASSSEPGWTGGGSGGSTEGGWS